MPKQKKFNNVLKFGNNVLKCIKTQCQLILQDFFNKYQHYVKEPTLPIIKAKIEIFYSRFIFNVERKT